MGLHPLRVLDRALDEYRDYLRTEFRAKDLALKQALEQALDRPRFLAQETFFQAHRPFREGDRWRDLPIDPRLAQVMERRARGERAYRHQSLAIAELRGPSPRPVVVTTGTGSGKTEAFLLPAIQNAIEDAVRFTRPGLTALLVYPMNALANDQLLRIEEYLKDSGFAGAVTVERYDRGTSEEDRDRLRRSPPRILLTNYMMLEYLLVRPADREQIFANHRCRFLVLDEVHSYRGTLGSNIALLVRRLRAHLGRARQDWNTDPPAEIRAARFPTLVPIGTSATIKSASGDPADRERSVQEFFGRLAGVDAGSILVLGEELEDPLPPPDSAYPARLLWDLNRWLPRTPMSAADIVTQVRAEVPERSTAAVGDVYAEVMAALTHGAALPDGAPGALRLRAHRLVRGGWRFHRCVDPGCGRLYPMGEDRCDCGRATAPLYLCRNCGADYLRLVGDINEGPLLPGVSGADGFEWMVYDAARLEPPVDEPEPAEDEPEAPTPSRGRGRGQRPQIAQMRERPVERGSLDPATLAFSRNETDYSWRVTLAPARTRCLCCGGSAGSRNVVTPVALGTSAAVKVLGEGLAEALAFEHRDDHTHDGKERLLVFSDSRQDAAHQARFIAFASRYDRMRRRLVQILGHEGELPLQRVVELLGAAGIQESDNPHRPETPSAWVPDERLKRIRAWEEAPLLDDLSVTAGYRGSIVNLGLVGVSYHRLDEYLREAGGPLARVLSVTPDALAHICRAMLDELRVRGCLSREMLRYHPKHARCPDWTRAAEWERRVKQPRGYAAAPGGAPVPFIDREDVPMGVTAHNAWRKPQAGGREPSLERIVRRLLAGFGGIDPTIESMEALLDFLYQGQFLVSPELYGARDSRRLLQVNDDVVRLALVTDAERVRCDVCGAPLARAVVGAPCTRCHGSLVRWPERDVALNRAVRRIRTAEVAPLEAAEHTAQVPNDVRLDLEQRFKAPATMSKLNVLACSPTLEMGIDVGGLDAVVLRNVPPRPDNYAQRGGRAGRRSRVGLVLGYARNTPHDQYFYERPAEMISGEIPAPVLALGNRDVLLRHLNAIAFGAAEPGLAGRMLEYVSPTGEIQQTSVDALKAAVLAQVEPTLALAAQAWGAEVLAEAALDEAALRTALETLPDRIQDVVDRTARQVIELRQALERYHAQLTGVHPATRAGELVARLLGIRSDRRQGQTDADDRSAGYPLRRFAEFGILPGYEFPSEPATLRLLGDPHEEDPVSVARRFGLDQFRPDAHVHARSRRWKVVGLDTSSPWNPQSDAPSWLYRRCARCALRFGADDPRCPRCAHDAPGRGMPALELGGFLAVRDETPILDEEDRFAARSLVIGHPQWDGDVAGRWSVGPGWSLRWSQREEVQWLNEGDEPTAADRRNGLPVLGDRKGYLVCSACGRMLTVPPPVQTAAGGRRRPRTAAGPDPYGHADACVRRGVPPQAIALATPSRTEVLRLIAPVPSNSTAEDFRTWGLSLGYALRIGMRRLYMLDGPEIEFEMEGPWPAGEGPARHGRVSLTFIDPSVGGSGYLRRIASEFHLVARRALDHLDHDSCETACYRCLKSYQNQRHHEALEWPRIIPDLEALADREPESHRREFGDIDDPRPWLEAYAAGVGSPLELRFLRLFEQHGFRPERQVPLSAEPEGLPITLADFAVPERRLAIYVDGAAFHVGQNLRRDRFIRARLRGAAPPWRVEELRAADLRLGEALIRRLLQE